MVGRGRRCECGCRRGGASGWAGVALGIIAVVIASTGTAIAATGGSFILGRANTASTLTSLTNSAGVPLRLNARSGYPPLAVNSTKQVPYLNADLLDGSHASAFLRTTGTAANAQLLDGLDSSAFALRSDVGAGATLTDADGNVVAGVVDVSANGSQRVVVLRLVNGGLFASNLGDGQPADIAWIVYTSPSCTGTPYLADPISPNTPSWRGSGAGADGVTRWWQHKPGSSTVLAPATTYEWYQGACWPVDVNAPSYLLALTPSNDQPADLVVPISVS